MGFVPQNQNVFTSMTVQENLEMGAFIRRDEIDQTMQQVYALFPVLLEKRQQPAGELSGGQRQAGGRWPGLDDAAAGADA